MTKGELRDNFIDHIPMLVYLSDLDAGIFNLTEKDYLSKPAFLIAALKLYKNMKIEKQNEKPDFYRKVKQIVAEQNTEEKN